MNEEMDNKVLLEVMDELRDDRHFNQKNQVLIYQIPKENEAFDGKKVVAVYQLVEYGGVEIMNKGEERLSHYKIDSYGGQKVIEYELEKHVPKLKPMGIDLSTVYDFHLKINYGSFNRILKRVILAVKGTSLNEYDVDRQAHKNKLSLNKKLSEGEKALTRFKSETDINKRSRRWKVLLVLGDFKEHFANDLAKTLGVDSISSMKWELNKNLEGSGLFVDWKRSKEEINRKGPIWWLSYDVNKIKSPYRAH